MTRPLLFTLLFSFAAQAKTVTYAVAIGNNAPPARESGELPTLRYADDDAVRYDAFFSRLTPHHWLLSVLDAQTQRRYPGATAQAQPPSLSALRALLRQLATRMQADRERGDEPVLFLSYSGHGAHGTDGVFLTMLDGELTRQVLHEEIFAALPAAFVHLFLDACHAEAVVGARGLFSSERDAATAPLAKAELATVVEGASLARFPHVGALMAATEEQESHEWSQLQAGVFTHELLSALTGAADVNGDGVIEYSEAQAFVVSANRDVKDPRALPRVVASPPTLNPRAPLVRLTQLSGVTFLEDDLSALGHFHVELDDGERYLDAHLTAETRARIALPADRLAFLVAGGKEASLKGRSAEAKRLADLEFRPRSTDARGSIESSQRAALFASPFGPTYYRGFADSAGAVRVPFGVERQAAASSGPRSVPALIVGGLGAASLVGAGVTGALASSAKADFDRTELQRPAEEARQRFALFGNASWIAAGAGAALLLTGTVLWFTAPQVEVAPVIGPNGAGLAVGGTF